MEAGRKIKGMADLETVVPLSCGRQKGAEISYFPGRIVLVREGSWGMLKGKEQGQCVCVWEGWWWGEVVRLGITVSSSRGRWGLGIWDPPAPKKMGHV